MARKQTVYSDFSGGLNDSAAEISILDTELAMSENADYSAEVKSLRTRKGSKTLNKDGKEFLGIDATYGWTYTFVDPETLTSDLYTLTYNGTNWKIGDTVVDLDDYGITITGTPSSGEHIYIIKSGTTYTTKRTKPDTEIHDMYVWSSGPTYKKCVLVSLPDGHSYIYELNADGTYTQKVQLTDGATNMYPFFMFNSLYFGDGSQIYSWGVPDYVTDGSTTAQAISITTGQVIKNTASATNGSVKGNFYKAVRNMSVVDANNEDYTVIGNWEDVTDVPFFSSTVVKAVTPPDKSTKEKVKLTVINGNSTGQSATISIVLGTGTTASSTITISATIASSHTSIADVVSDIKSAIESYTNITDYWNSIVSDDNSVTLTATNAKLYANGYVDNNSTGITVTYATLANGKANDNKLDPIRKCTMFYTHSSSYRVFACGNPEDNAVYYSEIGEPLYFISDTSKVYAANGYGKPTALFQLSDSMLISFENGWYCWDGVTPLEDASWKPLNLPYGCVSNKTIALTPYSFIFLGNDGIYNVSTSILSDVGTLVYNKNIIKKITSNKVDNLMRSITNKSICRGIFHNNAYYLSYVNGKTSEARVLKYEWDTSSYTEITGWKVNSFATDNSKLFFSSLNHVFQGECDDSWHDVDVYTGNNKPIALRIKTKAYHFGNPLVDKVCNLVGFIFKQTMETAQDDILVEGNVIMGYSTFPLDSLNTSESLVYGRTWGHLWGFREDICKMIEISQSNNTFQIELRNDVIDNPVTLIAIGFVYEVTDYVTPNMLKDEVLLQ